MAKLRVLYAKELKTQFKSHDLAYISTMLSSQSELAINM